MHKLNDKEFNPCKYADTAAGYEEDLSGGEN